MKKLYYPSFKVRINDDKYLVDFEDTLGEGRFITMFVEEYDMELEGIRIANNFKKCRNIQINNLDRLTINIIIINELEEKLLNFAKRNCDLKINKIVLYEVDYYYSDKAYCYNCKEWFYEDDSCNC